MMEKSIMLTLVAENIFAKNNIEKEAVPHLQKHCVFDQLI